MFFFYLYIAIRITSKSLNEHCKPLAWHTPPPPGIICSFWPDAKFLLPKSLHYKDLAVQSFWEVTLKHPTFLNSYSAKFLWSQSSFAYAETRKCVIYFFLNRVKSVRKIISSGFQLIYMAQSIFQSYSCSHLLQKRPGVMDWGHMWHLNYGTCSL